MKVVLLAGGLGTRIREETEFRPKPMILVGTKPILWHLMRIYAHHGHSEFVVCAGYRGEVIREYFREFDSLNFDFTVKVGTKSEIKYHDRTEKKDLEVTVTDTGQETMTGGRLFKARKYLGNDTFLCTYGDGLSDVNISKVIDFHKKHGKIATLTAVRPPSRFGVVEIEQDGSVSNFREKPKSEGWINAGFFVFNSKIFDYLDEKSILENEPLDKLSKENNLMAYKHDGYWQPMDTLREMTLLNELWAKNEAPWKVW